MDEIITRILKKSGCPELFDVLSNMQATDLQSLLLELYRNKATQLTPAQVLKQYETNRFVTPADISPVQLVEFEKLAFDIIPDGFEPISISPLSPLGSCSALGTVNQNKVVTTIRNTEICADSTNIMALESAKRRKQYGMDKTVKLTSSHRVMRAQLFDNPAFTAHFIIFSLTTAGRMSPDYNSLITSLYEHIKFYLELIKTWGSIELTTDNIMVGITAINLNLKQRLEGQLIGPLKKEYPQISFLLDQTRTSALNYYQDVAIAIKAKSLFDGNYYQLVDGGNTDWTQKLLNNRKEYFLSSCIGVDLFLKMFTGDR